MNKEKNDKRLPLGVALGGGGARGAAHIGVLQKFKEAGIKIDIISGVSAGSVVAAMYAFSEDPLWIESKFRDLLSKNHFLTRKVYLFLNSLSLVAFSVIIGFIKISIFKLN